MPVIKIDRQDLLRTCWTVFHRHGYYNTSISMLAEATGLGKSGLLHHFSSKVTLMQAVLEFARNSFQDYVLAVIKEDLPWEQRLEKMLRRQARLAKIDRRGCFYANTALETGREEIFKEIITATFEEWHIILTQLLSERMDATYASDKAYQLILEYEGAVTFYKFSGKESHLENYVIRTLKSFN